MSWRLAAGMLLGAGLAAGCRKPRATEAALDAGNIVTLRDVGFASPAAALHDPLQDAYYISNSNGTSLAHDDNGFISVVSPAGRVLQLKWIDGASDSVTLHAPSGMAVGGRLLYVADVDAVRRFDRVSGTPQGEVAIPGAVSLTGLAIGVDGSLYATDSGPRPAADGSPDATGAAAIYRIESSGKLDTLARGAELGHPSGIALTGDSVWVVGGNQLYRLAGGARQDVVTLPVGGLTGLTIFNGEAFIASREDHAVYRGPLGGPFRKIVEGLAGPAGLAHDLWRHRLVIPRSADNALELVPLVAF